jgi:hypothetical protein
MGLLGLLRGQIYFFYMQIMFVSHEHTGLHGLLWGWLYFLYVDDVCTSQETRLWTSLTFYGIALLFYT